MREYKQNGSQEARSQLVLYYSYIAKSLAAKMTGTYQKYATTEEMVNQGVIALIDSLDRFDPGKGVKFSTYAFTKVRGRSSTMCANRTGSPGGCGRWISASPRRRTSSPTGWGGCPPAGSWPNT